MYHTKYWSETKLINCIRSYFGIDKPEYATAEQWRDYNMDIKANHPYIHWLTDEFVNGLQDLVYWPAEKLHAVRYHIYNRWIEGSHIVHTGLQPGKFYELDTRILHGLFTELVNYIEIEKAWFHCACNAEAHKKFRPPSHWRLSVWRCPEAGLEYLDWEMTLKDDDGISNAQAEAAAEQRRLYDWWKNVRPNRPDPYDASGWTAYCLANRGDDIFDRLCDTDEADREHKTKMLNAAKEMEEQYDQEDTDMMIALIKIRHSLWT